MAYLSGQVAASSLAATIDTALSGLGWTQPQANFRLSPNGKIGVTITVGGTLYVNAGIVHYPSSSISSFALHHQTLDPAGLASYYISTSTNSFIITVGAPTSGTGSPGLHTADSMGMFRVKNYADDLEAWLILGFPTQQPGAPTGSTIARFTGHQSFGSPYTEQHNTGAFYWSAATGMVQAQLLTMGSPNPYVAQVSGVSNPMRHASGAPLLQHYVVQIPEGTVGRARDLYLLHNQYGTSTPATLTGDTLPTMGDILYVNGVEHRVHTPYASYVDLNQRGRTPLCPIVDYTEKRPHIVVRSA